MFNEIPRLNMIDSFRSRFFAAIQIVKHFFGLINQIFSHTTFHRWQINKTKSKRTNVYVC